MIVAVLSILLTFLFYYVMAMDKDASVRGIKDADRYLPTAEEKAASSELMENIVQQDYAASRNLILIYENKNTQDIQLEITVTYYDEMITCFSCGTIISGAVRQEGKLP